MPPTTQDLLTALQQVEKRADRWPDEQEILSTYVEEPTLVAALGAPDNGIIYGRRGTGKTHTLRFLGEREREKDNFALFIDLDQMVGSTTGIYNDRNYSIAQRATRLLVDVLGLIQNALIEDAFSRPSHNDALSILDKMLDHVGEVVVADTAEHERIMHEDQRDTSGLSLDISLSSRPGFTASARAESEDGTSIDDRRTVTGTVQYRVHFGATSNLMRQAVANHPADRFWILFDEWSILPLDLQPYLAEMLRRLFFRIPKVIVRVAAIPHRTEWRIPKPDGGYIGVEVGSEIFTLLDLDEFVVFPARSQDEQRARASAFFRSLLFRHLSLVLQDTNKQLDGPDQMISLLFTQVTAFHELIRAAEGVPRDALAIASRAALRAGNRRISTDHVRDAAAQVFQTNKQALLNGVPLARKLLDIIIDEVISAKKARAFMLEQEDTSHPLIQQLVDDRILHIIKKGYSHQDEPGARFDVLQIDYGCYVRSLHTTGAPLTLFGEGAPGDDEVLGAFYGNVEVPDDDYRAIRRSVLDLTPTLARIGAVADS